MGSPERVHPHGFEDLNLAFESSDVDGGAEAPEIMMLAHTPDLDGLPIEGESLFCIECECADAERRCKRVSRLAVRPDIRHRTIQVRVFERPEGRISHLECFINKTNGIVWNDGSGFPLRHFPPRAVDDARCEADGLRLSRGIANPDPHCNGGFLFRYPWCGDKRSPMINPNILRSREPDVPVDPGAGVIAGVRLLGIVNPNGQNILLFPEVQVRRQFIFE